MKTAILVHGHHLFADNWEGIVWGEPKNGVYGRAAAGLREALRFDAELILFPTGSSVKDGLTDGEYALKVARERISEMPEFVTMGEEAARKWFDKRAVPETDSQNTREEVIAAGRIARLQGAERIIQVSSPTHIMRAHQNALAAYQQDEELRPFLRSLYAIASDIGYSPSVEDVLIIEPAHRPDRAKVPFSETLRDIFSFSADTETARVLNERLKEVIEDMKKRLK